MSDFLNSTSNHQTPSFTDSCQHCSDARIYSEPQQSDPLASPSAMNPNHFGFDGIGDLSVQRSANRVFFFLNR